ncbi:hypothetical protein SNE40_011709 [Patella caerulea]|uniref:BTB domain-containing protein n=1 Tax=Patella caerulea TaxID=87958 RepID=A0AAN8JME0_PATCE
MDLSRSSLDLMQYDQLEYDNSDDNVSLSSGYESGDSCQSERDTSPAPCGSTKEMMVFKSRESLCDNLDYILSMSELCDVVFLVGEEKIPVYGLKAILATRSRVLYQLILHNQREAKVNKKKVKGEKLKGKLVIEMKNYDEEVFRRFISFIHCGKIKVDIDTVIGLFCASFEFEMNDLRGACWYYFVRSLKKQRGKMLASVDKYKNHKGIGYIIKKASPVTYISNHPYLNQLLKHYTLNYPVSPCL